MATERRRLLVRHSIYWDHINVDIENAIKNSSSCLEFKATQPKDKLIPRDIPGKLWETVYADILC